MKQHEVVFNVARALGISEESEIKLTKLKMGLTNQSFLATFDGSCYVVRLNNPRSAELGIERCVESFNLKIVSEARVCPEVVFNDGRMVITKFIKGRNFLLSSPSAAQALSIELKKVHLGTSFRSIFCPFSSAFNYLALSKQSGFQQSPESIEIGLKIQKTQLKYRKTKFSFSPCHCDLTASNIIQTKDKVWVLDWEYSAMSDYLYDFAKIAVSTNMVEETKVIYLSEFLGRPPSSDEYFRFSLLIAAVMWWDYCWSIYQSCRDVERIDIYLRDASNRLHMLEKYFINDVII
ncbi:MAG TPA: phosphotransferase [Oligoflexia bacterium]|nr:phosphotransferase [Oligoflexia bacterium]HMP49132.1 phosphotransferase [Oligoflexia bacterium]